MQMALKIGPKGQIVIPKFVRESLGVVENGKIVLSITEEKKAVLKPLESDILGAWEEQAQKVHANVSKKWIYGDRLYEEEFS